MSLSIDLKELEALQKRLEKATEEQRDEFFDGCAKKLAGDYLNRVIKKTPLGKYPIESGKKGGTLRRGWTANKKQDPKKYAQTLPVAKSGKDYSIECENIAEANNKDKYASYVEFGHRQTPGRYVPAIGKRLVASYVPPQYFMKQSNEEFEPKIAGIVEKYADKFFKEVINGE